MKLFSGLFFILAIISWQAKAQERGNSAPASRASTPNPKSGAAPAKASGGSPNFGVVMNDGAAVYQAPNFDSPVIGYVTQGKTYNISRNLYGGAFYRILVKAGTVGYIADSDVKSLGSKAGGPNQKEAKAKEEESRRQKRPFSLTQYFGLEYANIHFREDTMGLRPSQNLSFVGVKLFGPNLLIEGAMVTEMNFLFYPNAPSYYSDATGKSAVGWIFIADALFQMVSPHGKNTVTYFGFGPMFKYSKFDVELQGATQNTRYSLEDMVLGVAFDLGIGFRINRWAIRAETQFYWEKLNYSGLGLAIQRDF